MNTIKYKGMKFIVHKEAQKRIVLKNELGWLVLPWRKYYGGLGK